jgi:nitroreductase
MDAFLAIASKRDKMHPYSGRPIPDDVVRRILDAGRLAGSAQNRQPWRFLVVEDAERREQLAEAVYEPENVREAQLVVAISGGRPFDLGRCAQNMMVAAWNEGVASSPNGIADAEKAKAALSVEEPPATVLTLGYPAEGRDPQSRPPEVWSARANRKPLDELVERL